MNAQPNPPRVPRVLCMGDMTVDIFAQAMPRLPQPGELLLADRIACFPGGNALNAAVALLRMGDPASFFGVLGDDALGDLLVGELTKIGLDMRGVRRVPGCPTPATLIYRAEGEDRRYISALGAGGRFTGERLPEELIPDHGVVLAAGYLKLRSWNDDALIEVFQKARQRGCRNVLNVCVPRDGEADVQRCLRLLPHVDVFLPNEDEARVLTGEERPEAQARALRMAGARLAIVTRGSQGLYAQDDASSVEMGAFEVPLVDPTGCGDCFTAGVVAGLLREWDVVRILTFASAAGALGATALGCTSGVLPFAEVERFVRENRLLVSVQRNTKPMIS
ncbi:MAG TPA: carbohydrate kinase family protein [Candidatus Paceibacterota bacterium]|nr:carbohydrate kinase family protein [Verrucomicrobiota bacterium]HOX04215.1 carbohydrate kinase family protein [Verrucomicrobiota bacterium]HRZ47155.1 carbohydrate kinase family protein [Candidatus Paceibacterota bacterium]HRZ92859.1 carbohydrate kinase family protein [Candidatus Paceibacterota bacterium]